MTKGRNKQSKEAKKRLDLESQRIERDEIQNLEDFIQIGSKADGVTKGGVYSRPLIINGKPVLDNNGNPKTEKFMIKSMDPYSIVSEYVGAGIARIFLGERAPEVFLVKSENGEVFVASKFIENFETLKSLSERLGMPKECFPYGCVFGSDGKLHPITSYLSDIYTDCLVNNPKLNSNLNHPTINGAEEVAIIADYLQHSDAHDRNVGVKNIDVPASISANAALIDFSWSLRGYNQNQPVYYDASYLANFDINNVIKAIDNVLSVSPKRLKMITKKIFKNLEKIYKDDKVFVQRVPPTDRVNHVLDIIATDYLEMSSGIPISLNEVKKIMFSSLDKRASVLRDEKDMLQAELVTRSLTVLRPTPNQTGTYMSLNSPALNGPVMIDQSHQDALMPPISALNLQKQIAATQYTSNIAIAAVNSALLVGQKLKKYITGTEQDSKISAMDLLKFPSAEAISPPASNSGYVVQDLEKPTKQLISQNSHQLIEPNPQKTTTIASNPLADPSYKVGFTDNLQLLRVAANIGQNIANNLNTGWINLFGENADPSKVKEAINNSKKQFKDLKQPLMDSYQEIIESYEPKVEIHNKKPNQPLGEEIYQLKQLKEQAEQMMKYLREAQQEAKKLKADLKDGQAVKQAHLVALEQKIVKISQASEKFFTAIEKSKANSDALKKPTVSELEAVENISTKIDKLFVGDNKARLPKLTDVEQLPLDSKIEISSSLQRNSTTKSKPVTGLIK